MLKVIVTEWPGCKIKKIIYEIAAPTVDERPSPTEYDTSQDAAWRRGKRVSLTAKRTTWPYQTRSNQTMHTVNCLINQCRQLY